MREFFKEITNEIDINENIVREISPITLAYIGDAVYELYIRSILVKGNPKKNVNEINKETISYVKAQAQSETLHSIMESLTDEEKEVVRRGRNAKSGTVPKNANLTEYKHATAFECLIGYMYITREYDRLFEIIKKSVDGREI